MARIKAKPMNRLPMPPVGPAIGPIGKNGYRTPPAATVTPPVFDPTTPYPTTQRLFYTNGSSLTPSVNYGSQVQIYVSVSACFLFSFLLLVVLEFYITFL